MNLVLLLIPIFAVFAGFFIYRHNGKHELFRLDLVQFFYIFVLAPLIFVWAKTALYFLAKSELGTSLSVGELISLDTLLSVFLLYIYAFAVMHSLTKSFRLKAEQDPWYDLFGHSEYIHLWLTHIVVNIGSLTFLVIMAMLNAFLPLSWNLTRPSMILLCALGAVSGTVVFMSIWLTDPHQEGRRFMRLMKLAIGMGFLFLVSGYLLMDIPFQGSYGLFWFVFPLFAAMVLWAFVTYKSARASRLVAKFGHQSKDTVWWGVNPQLFASTRRRKVLQKG